MVLHRKLITASLAVLFYCGPVSANDDCQNATTCSMAGIKYTAVLVASLPTCNSGLKGTVMLVSDALLPTYLATMSGGGTNTVLVVCNGTNWVAD